MQLPLSFIGVGVFGGKERNCPPGGDSKDYFVMTHEMQWLVLRSKPNREAALSNELAMRDIPYFCPLARVQPVNPRSRNARPLFPGYLFVQVDLQKIGFSDLNWLPFSQGLLSFGGELSQIPGDLILSIRRQVETLNAAGEHAVSGLRHGDRVQIMQGAFAGYEAIFDISLPGHERVRLLLELASGRYMPVRVPAALIKRS